VDAISTRCEIALEVIEEIGNAKGPAYDRAFYEKMMKLKRDGCNLWYPEEEEYYRRMLNIEER
jgi:hypothetical protein